MEKRFPILGSGCFSIPFSVLEPHRERLKRESGQTLERLAERGGLDADELDALEIDWRGAAGIAHKEMT